MHFVENPDRPNPCPDCWGRGYTVREEEVERGTIRNLTLGQVNLEVTTTALRERYMAVETGIGSGTIWGVEQLFTTYEKAVEAARLSGVELE